jgi:hypothetical protein
MQRSLFDDLAPEDLQPPPMEEKRELRRRPDNHHFGSLLMLAVTVGVFLLITWVATRALFVFLQEAPIP